MQGFADDSVSFDLEKIVTLRGKTYRDILIMDADKNGLLFRHRDGIAKLSFSELGAGLAAMYQLTDDKFSSEAQPVEEPIESGGVIIEESKGGTRRKRAEVAVIRQTNILVQQVQPVNPYRNSCYCPPVYWPRHWGRYHSAHNLVNPYCRAAVLQDFLYTTGLVRRPPGVYVHRLPSATPWNFR